MKSKPKRLIVVVGPTAVGKTDKAIELALLHQCPIISCDSRQVYKELNIGVAKPEPAQLEKVRHYFISNKSIHEDFDAGKFAMEARLCINELFQTYDNLIICGGTGLYLKALLDGLDNLPGKDEQLRAELDEIYKNEGIKALQERLLELNPTVYHQIDIQNPQRLIRAIEIASGTKTEGIQLPEFEFEFETEMVKLDMDREMLYNRINKRVDLMIEAGLETEARALYEHRHLNALQTVGYKEWWPYFEGEYELNTVIDKIKQHSRNYAKRQLTWFRKT